MKRTICLAIGVSMLCMAGLSSVALSAELPGERKISVAFEAAPLADALKEVQTKSGLHLVFAQELVEGTSPVTLELKDTAAEEVLYRLLRPCGIEFIYTGEQTAALVENDSLLTIAKTVGRALRAFVRLEEKLEYAVVEGDEVRVPGWASADDRALADALTDLISVIAYLDVTRPRSGSGVSIDDIEAMFKSPDVNVRRGAFLVVLSGRYRSFNDDQAEQERFLRVLEAAAKDPDPSVRAWVLMIFLESSVSRKGRGKEIRDAALSAAFKDPAREVRFAAAICAAIAEKQFDEDYAAAGKTLASDKSAAVRFATQWARMMTFERSDPERFRSAGIAMLNDPNPIVRSLGLAVWGVVGMRKEEMMNEMTAAAAVAALEDPWLRTCSRFMASMKPGTDGSNTVQASINLLGSGKPSHEILGFVACWVNVALTFAQSQSQEAPLVELEASGLQKLMSSERLWPRLGAPMLAAMIGGDEGERIILTGMKSPEVIERLMALACLCMNADRGGNGTSLSPEARAALKNAFKSPIFAEKFLAGEKLSSFVSFDEALALLRDEIARDREGVNAKIFLKAASSHRQFRQGSEEEQAARLAALIDTILSVQNAELEIEFAQTAYWQLRKGPAAERFIAKAQAGTLKEMLTNPRMQYQYINRPELRAAFLARFHTLFESANKNSRLLAVEGFSALVENAHDLSRVGTDSARELIGKMLDTCFKGDPDEVRAGLGLLKTFVATERRPFVSWEDIPVEARKTIVKTLGYVNDKAYGREAAEILGGLYRHNRHHGTDWDIAAHDPDVKNAMEEARRKVMDTGSVEDQIALLCWLIRVKDKTDAQAAYTDLEQRFMADEVPAEQQVLALELMRNYSPYYLSSEFAEHVLTAFMAGEGERPVQTARLYLLARGASYALRQNDAPLPSWVPKAAEFARQKLIAPDPEHVNQSHAVQLYVSAAGEGAKDLIEQIVLDKNQPPDHRAYTASWLNKASPETKVYEKLLETYEDLPVNLRLALAGSAVESPKAVGSEAFVIKALNDEKGLNHRRMQFAHNIADHMQDTPTLRAALEELKKDRQIGGIAQFALTLFDQKAEREAKYNAVISGTLTDEREKPLAGAQVVATGGGNTRDAKTDQAGKFRIDGLRNGRKYRITASAPGYNRASLDDVLAGREDIALQIFPPAYEWYGMLPPTLQVEKWFNTEPLDLNQLKGKVVLLDLGVHIRNDASRIKGLRTLAEKYKPQGLVVIAVHRSIVGGNNNASDEEVEEFIKKNRVAFPIAMDRAEKGQPYGKTSGFYGVTQRPALLLIDKKGCLSCSIRPDADNLEAEIKGLLGE